VNIVLSVKVVMSVFRSIHVNHCIDVDIQTDCGWTFCVAFVPNYFFIHVASVLSFYLYAEQLKILDI